MGLDGQGTRVSAPNRNARSSARRSCAHAALVLRSRVQEEERQKGTGELKGNTKSLINAKDVPAPGFASSEFLKSHYGSMLPEDKFHTPQLISHNYGWAGRKPLEPPSLRANFGRVNARLETNDPK